MSYKLDIDTTKNLLSAVSDFADFFIITVQLDMTDILLTDL